MIVATMPPEHHDKFKPQHRFPESIVSQASAELDNFAKILEHENISVYRSEDVDWFAASGYTGAMPRDALLVVGNTIFESCFAWQSRACEVSLAYGSIISKLQTEDAGVHFVASPKKPGPDTIYDNVSDGKWAINNSRPAFDAADFMRFGHTLLGQLSNVTNMKGVEHISTHLPPGYRVELLEVSDPHAMHIDATILPLREGLLVYNPLRVSEESLRRHAVLRDWELIAYPFPSDVQAAEKEEGRPPRFMTSAWIVINVLVLGNGVVVVEESDERFAEWLEAKGMRVIRAPFQHVHAIGGSFHCASLDLLRL
jgi:glycine amidinotransferase